MKYYSFASLPCQPPIVKIPRCLAHGRGIFGIDFLSERERALSYKVTTFLYENHVTTKTTVRLPQLKQGDICLVAFYTPVDHCTNVVILNLEQFIPASLMLQHEFRCSNFYEMNIISCVPVA